MKIISELKFLEKDKRFKQCLDPEELKEFEWYLKFDEYVKAEIKKLPSLIEKKNAPASIHVIGEIRKRGDKEVLFFAKIRKCARDHKLNKELTLIEDAFRRLQKSLNLFSKANAHLWKGNISLAEKELNKIYALF